MSLVAGVVVAALAPSVTLPLKVLLPLIVWVVSSVVNAPVPPIAWIVVALPPAPPVPTPMKSLLLDSEYASSALASVVGAAVEVDLLMRRTLAKVGGSLYA